MSDALHIPQAVAQVLTRLEDAERQAGRDPGTVSLLVASKTQTPERIALVQHALQQAGRPLLLGENYVQEFKRKRDQLHSPFEAHLIGGLQRNKAKDAVRLFDVIESLDSLELAEALDHQAAQAGKVQRVFLQVNVSLDERKRGIAPQELFLVADQFRERFAALEVQGLMTITELYQDPSQVKPDFERMAQLHRSLQERWGRSLALSMGMSSDYELAVQCGATLVRVGSALFGPRS